MKRALRDLEAWFVAGSQHLYGETKRELRWNQAFYDVNRGP